GGPLFEDPRAERTLSLPPGIPVPDYPLVITPSVETLIHIFTARDRERFGLWIARSGRYLGMIQRIFRARGLPEELAYTAMIESGFSPYAVSRVGAKGMWQFMEGTARRYGLTVNRWVDERLDPVRATVAAAQYLGDLYDMFGHWFLAQAAYNADEARMAKAIQRAPRPGHRVPLHGGPRGTAVRRADRVGSPSRRAEPDARRDRPPLPDLAAAADRGEPSRRRAAPGHYRADRPRVEPREDGRG